MKPSCTSESSIKERQRSSLRHKVGRSIISSHCQTSRKHTGESAQDASCKVGRIEIFVASLHSRDHICPKDILSTESRLLISKARNRPAIGAVSRGKSKKKKQRKCQTLLLKKRLHSFDHTSHHNSSRMGEIEYKTDNYIPFVVPGRVSNRSPDPSSVRPKADAGWWRPPVKNGNRHTRIASTIHGKITSEIVKFGQMSLQLTWKQHRGHVLFFRASSGETCFEQSREKAQFIHSFSQDPNYEVCKHTKVTRAPCRRNLDDRVATGKNYREIYGIWPRQTTNFSMKTRSRDSIADMQWSCRTWQRNGFKTIHAKPNQPRRRREISETSYVQKTIQHPFVLTILWNLSGEELNWTRERCAPHRSETHEIAERAVRRAIHQHEAVARQNLVSALARNTEAHNYNVEMQVRHSNKKQIEICSWSKSSSWRSARKFGNGRDEHVNDSRTKLSLQALHVKYVSQQQNHEYAGLHQHLTRSVHETQQYRDMFEESRTARSATGPEIDRLRRRAKELLREVRRQTNERANVDKGIGCTWTLRNPRHQKDCNWFASYAAKFGSCKYVSIRFKVSMLMTI